MSEQPYDVPLLTDALTPSPDAHDHGPDCHWCDMTGGGPAAGDAAMDGVSKDAAWWAETSRWLSTLPAWSYFTADDLVDVCGKPGGSPNQIGARIRSWASMGLCTPVGHSRGRRPESHGRYLRMWQVTA